ncbi:MAG: hypothetical protein ACD_52C00020G0004 [uncultured bacterium]|uniref:Uncharacterized protein n=1 Tax=Candidatus Woesebacteria bacterium RIFCSPHIGHO2_12_FULL_41_24 TaxID=1802510 RepID=A0A1F8AQX9_9BACT|nr:MAG: hypothetical protein ACD_52C00020G0004 [uncultured bacterium]OGM13400.1 MAG: hypothetical protein A2W15_05890 [Candidatus Woesebacteria bacterium RBG_16_41_13]OGM30498.1 MAG: hypothetical protein A2873_02635 [Candidatus Woesebacteria bacterium RIFCSPHIGHO2_01_FULL_42_80]OGM35944.1 MAG: hypothetical protein A3D84_01680 [Candidatus Woesebacteria bacterium RIFCSPHIGHO2_02_FULL_42_20]OGM54164.1 MAG: hypothetical protein A3E44_00580 [Candidatus Woesebacteria bacterium RIFCSPHIGHO2_12_FULL_41
MLETPHVAVAAAIAAKIPNPFISLPLALASHFLLERVPHWNPHLMTETKKFGKPTSASAKIIALDVAASLVTGFSVASASAQNTSHYFLILSACLLSVLPDLVESPYFFLKVRNKFMEKWIAFQGSIQNDTTPFIGLATQAATYALALLIAFN